MQQGSLFHHIWIDPAGGIGGINQRIISARFQTNSHCHRLPGGRLISEIAQELLECSVFPFRGFVGSRQATTFYLNVASVLEEWVFFPFGGSIGSQQASRFYLDVASG